MKKINFKLILIVIIAISQMQSKAQVIQYFANNSFLPGFNAYGDGGLAMDARFYGAGSPCKDNQGNIYLLDVGDDRIRRIDALTGIVSTFAGCSQTQSGAIWYTTPLNYGTQYPANIVLMGGCRKMICDNNSNIYLLDQQRHQVLKIDQSNHLTVFVGNGTNNSTGYFTTNANANSIGIYDAKSIAVDANNDLYIAETPYGACIRKISPSGYANLFAGNPNIGGNTNTSNPITSRFNAIEDITIDKFGNMYICETYSYRIRKITASGVVSNFAGNGTFGETGNGSVAISASIRYSNFIRCDDLGNVYVSFRDNSSSTLGGSIRKIDGAGLITHIVGLGTLSNQNCIGQNASQLFIDLNKPNGSMLFDACNNLIIVNGYSVNKIINNADVGSITHPSITGVIKNVNIGITGSTTTNILSSPDGKYYWSPPNTTNANYTITPTKNNDVNKANGVTSADVVLVQRHILTANILDNSYKYIAADVTGDGNISSVDVIRIKRLILGSDTTFKNVVTQEERLWAFADKLQLPATSTTNPFINIGNTSIPPLKRYNSPSINLTNVNTCNPTGKDFYGVKLGDVNWDWNPALAKGVKPIELYYDNINATEKTNIQIPVRVNNFADIQAVQFSLSFDPTHFEFNSFENESLNFMYNANNAGTENNTGVISFVWVNDANEGVTLSDGSVLFYLTLHKKRSVKVDDIVLTSDLTQVQALNSSLEIVPMLKKKNKIIDNSAGSVQEYKDNWDILPNYSNMGNIMIKAAATQNKTVTLKVYDKEEQLVFESSRDLIEGDNIIYANIRNVAAVPQGVYYVKLVGMADADTKPLFIGNINDYATPEEIASGDISGVETTNATLALYSLQAQLYKQLKATPALANTAILQNFVNTYEASNFNIIYQVEQALTNGNNALATSLMLNFANTNAIDENYRSYFNWILKLLNHDAFTTNDETKLGELIVQCPLLAGMVVHSARDLMNCLTEDNVQFGDLCPTNSNTNTRSVNSGYVYKPTTIKPIVRKSLNNKNVPITVSVYPNPTKGIVHILIPKEDKGIWNITIQDVMGRVLQQQTTTAITKTMDVFISNQKGIYIITLTNANSSKKFVEKVVVE